MLDASDLTTLSFTKDAVFEVHFFQESCLSVTGIKEIQFRC